MEAIKDDARGLPWAEVTKFIRLLARSTADTKSSKQSVRPPIYLVEIRDRFMNTRQLIHLLEALQWAIQTLSADPRDKIFSFLGLCHDGPTFVPIPNYRQPLETILADMSKTMMRMNESFLGPHLHERELHS